MTARRRRRRQRNRRGADDDETVLVAWGWGWGWGWVGEGLDLGTNAMAALVTRGCYEMRRIGLSMGGRSETFMGE